MTLWVAQTMLRVLLIPNDTQTGSAKDKAS